MMSAGKLVRHVVFLQFKDEASEADLQKIGQAFLDLPAQIPEIHSLEWGEAVNENASYSRCLLVNCRTEADLKAYVNHPAHQAIPATYGPLVAGATEVDYWIEA